MEQIHVLFRISKHKKKSRTFVEMGEYSNKIEVNYKTLQNVEDRLEYLNKMSENHCNVLAKNKIEDILDKMCAKKRRNAMKFNGELCA